MPLCQLFKPPTKRSTSQSCFSCLCVHSSTSSMTALSLLIFLRGSWFCTLEGSPCTVKTLTWVNLAVSLRTLRTLSRYYASTPGCSLTWSCQSGSSCFTFHSNLSQKHSPVLSCELTVVLFPDGEKDVIVCICAFFLNY